MSGEGKIQSLVIGSALLTVGSLTFLLGLLADLVSRNRQLIEMTLVRVRAMDLEIQKLSTGRDTSKQPAVAEKFEDRRNG